jgi:hypothetical protein
LIGTNVVVRFQEPVPGILFPARIESRSQREGKIISGVVEFTDIRVLSASLPESLRLIC